MWRPGYWELVDSSMGVFFWLVMRLVWEAGRSAFGRCLGPGLRLDFVAAGCVGHGWVCRVRLNGRGRGRERGSGSVE